jgi:tetratricopeptide (TPR) repeat protein
MFMFRSMTSGAAALGLLLGLGETARADRVQDAHRRLGDIEQRTHMLNSSFRENYAPDPNIADRRVVEAEKLYVLKNYNAAATLCLDVIEKHPKSRTYDDALNLLAESLYKDGDLLSARRYFTEAVKKNTGHRREQVALQRLIEISLRTGDYTDVDDHLARLSRIPAGQVEPSVPYVRGKYLFFRDRLDDALSVFQSIPPGHEYYLQSRYFVGTIQVRKGDYATAARSFDEVLKQPAKTDDHKEIHDLARLAIGRLLYERGQYDRAREWYSSVDRKSKHFSESMYELAWNSIKAKDYKSAYRSLDLMLLMDPESAQAPELRLLLGDLHLRLSNFYLASTQFTSSLDEYEPIYRELAVRADKAKSDPQYFSQLLAKGLDKFDIAAVVPKAAVRLVSKEPDVAKMLVVVEDLGALQKGIKESEDLLVRLERAVASGNRIGIYPDLASARGRSTELMNQSIEVRRTFQADARALAANYLSAEDRAQLNQIAGERGLLDQELKNLPLTQAAMSAKAQQVNNQFKGVDAQASEVNVLLQSLEAELTAIEQYFIRSRAEQKIRPEDLEQPMAIIRQEIASGRETLERLRNDIGDAGNDARMAGASGAGERQVTARLGELLKREQDILSRARVGMRPDVGQQFEGYLSVLQRADALQSQLAEFDGRLDGIADRRLTTVREQITTEKENLQAAASKLGTVTSEGQTVGGSLAEAMMSRATHRFYDLTVRSDKGLIDVSWGIKDSKTQELSRLINQQKLELQAVDDDFQPLLREEEK